MTIPYERTRAQLETGFFLQDLADASATPGVPGEVRAFAEYLLRDYPNIPDPGLAHKALTEKFGAMPQLRRVSTSEAGKCFQK